MEVHIVGTGDAYALEGTNSSILVAQNGYRLSVDCGPTVPQTLWKSCHPWMEIDGIYFTHLHPDHAIRGDLFNGHDIGSHGNP